MFLKYLVPVAMLFCPAHVCSGATYTYLINFGDSTYTSDGVNTWNAPTLGFMENVTTLGNEISLLDTTGADNGLDFAVTFRGATQAGWMVHTANSGTTWPALSWFNSAVAAQSAFLNVWNGAEEQWLISGLAPTDSVNVQWIANHLQTNNTRTATFEIAGITSNVISGDAVSSLDFATHTNKDQYMEWNVSPDAGGDLEFYIDGTGNAFASWGNAIRIQVTTQESGNGPNVVPEPTSLMLCGFALISLIGYAAWSRKYHRS